MKYLYIAMFCVATIAALMFGADHNPTCAMLCTIVAALYLILAQGAGRDAIVNEIIREDLISHDNEP